MSSEPEKFILRTTLTSPFGFKARLAVEVLGLGDRVKVMPADVNDEKDSLRQQNPLGKIPCLVRPDGGGVFDSGVILEFLQDLAGTERLMPLRGPKRFEKFTRARLIDGIIDAGALIIYEGRWHEPAAQSQGWLAYQRGKMLRALAALEADPPNPRESDAVAIGLACALEFLDRRKPVEWRTNFPKLVAWFATFILHEPAFDRTRPPQA
jgi:glutathione S-transferase